MADKKAPFDLEKVYDEQIAPLMDRIIAICKEHKLPMFATFLYANNGENGGELCTTQMLFPEERLIPECMLRLEPTVYGSDNPPLRIRLTKSDGSVEDTVILL